MRKLKLTKDAKKAYKLWSVQASTVAVFVVMMEPALAHWEGILPEWVHSALLTVVLAASVILRLIDQGDDEDAELSERAERHSPETIGGPSGRTSSTAVPSEQEARAARR